MPSFEPVLDVVPHHFFREDFQLALTRRIDPNTIAFETTKGLIQLREGEDYMVDLFGKRTRDEVAKYLKGLNEFYQSAYDLSDDSFVRFGPQDGMCSACVIGNHCKTVNYFDGKKSHGKYSDDNQVIRIKRGLEEVGGKDGEDFIVKPDNQVFYDFGGGRLSEAKSINPVSVNINMLVARVGVVRSLAERQLDRPRSEIEILIERLSQLQEEER